MRKKFGVLGVGRFGSKIIKELHYKNQEVIAIDADRAIIDGIKEFATKTVIGDITNESILKEGGIQDCDTVIIAESSSIESNVIAAQLCKSLGVPNLICKAHSTVHGKILSKLGVDQIIFPEQDTAIKLVNRLTSGRMLDYFDMGGNLTIISTEPLDRWVGKTLADLDLRNKHNIVLLAIRRGNENFLVPSWSMIIEKGDDLVLFGKEESFKELKLDITHKT